MSIRHFIQEIEKGLRAPVYFLYSEESYLLKEASFMVSGAIPEAERSFGLSVYDLDGIDERPSLDQVIDSVNTLPFMGGRRTVILENVQELGKKEMEGLERYIADPAPSSVLVLLHRGKPKAQFTGLTKKVKAIPLDMREQDIPSWIRERARQKGLVLTDEALDYLIGLIGPDVGLISSELEKFILIGKNPINKDDIVDIVSGGNDYSVFDLVDAVKDRDAGRVFRIAKALQESADSYSLLGAINWHYSRLSQRDKGKRGYYDRVFGLLHEADLRIKTSGGTFPMEYLLIRLLRI
ncbi:MAG TPA: DNA polymerase III subunit delta [Thermodesulfovibrionales bacterium]|nr:DNA polymerase III subunit delta [Thermodesulfovibrionales bacterium]